MPIEVGIWKLGDKPERVEFGHLENEQRLEDVIAADVSILNPGLLLIGRQVPTAHGEFIDLLAMDADGTLVVIELKRDRTPRDVVAQVLDYGSWVRGLGDEDIAAIFAAYLKKYAPDRSGASLDDAFREAFEVEELPESLNESHELVIVASELDDSTERIVNYLTDQYGAAINAVFFRFFEDGGNQYLSRVWLIDPTQAEVKVVEKGGKEPWNGEYYVSFGGGEARSWDDARKYGFISAGGGAWYTKTLGMLEPNDRIWVNIPGRGYVGVGRVVESVVPAKACLVSDGSEARSPLTDVQTEADYSREKVVRVDWVKTVPLGDAIREKGFFGNQNTVAKPRAKKWPHTIERLKERLAISD